MLGPHHTVCAQRSAEGFVFHQSIVPSCLRGTEHNYVSGDLRHSRQNESVGSPKSLFSPPNVETVPMNCTLIFMRRWWVNSICHIEVVYII